MGAAQLLQSLDTHPRLCAVVAESSFSTFREIAYDRMGQPFHLGPWVGRTILRPLVEVAFLRARLKYHLNMDDISPEDSVAATTIPVLLIHGQSIATSQFATPSASTPEPQTQTFGKSPKPTTAAP